MEASSNDWKPVASKVEWNRLGKGDIGRSTNEPINDSSWRFQPKSKQVDLDRKREKLYVLMFHFDEISFCNFSGKGK